MATMKKAQSGITRRGIAGMKKLPSLNPKMVPGEMTGKMYKKSAIDKIGDKQAAELDKSGVFGKAAMAKKKAPKAQDGLRTGQYKRLGKIAEKNPARAEKVADRMNTKASRIDRGKEVSGRGNDVSETAENAAKRMMADRSWTMHKSKMKAGGMLKRADGSYSKRGLWDNIRAAKGSGKKPTAAMLKQEKKIKAKTKK
jgi:hypothetical protein